MTRSAYLRELERLREHLNALVEQAFMASDFGAEGAAPGSWSPPVDLFETADAYVLLAEVPGVERSELDLTVEGRRLVLSGRRRAPDDGGNFHRMERHHGPFRRAFDLDHDLDPEEIDAKLESGVLTIRVAKRDRVRRRVEVAGPADAGPEDDGPEDAGPEGAAAEGADG